MAETKKVKSPKDFASDYLLSDFPLTRIVDTSNSRFHDGRGVRGACEHVMLGIDLLNQLNILGCRKDQCGPH
jgi:hypothetical protein